MLKKLLRDATTAATAVAMAKGSQTLLRAGKAVYEGQKEFWGERKPS